MPMVGGNDSILQSAYSFLNVMTLLRTAPGRFVAVGPIPDWFANVFHDESPARELEPGRHSLFLENFLIDAEEFWKGGETGQFLSGPWAESDASGKDIVFEATAIQTDSYRLLLLHCPKLYETQQAIIQLARENSLKYDRLAKMQEALGKSEARINVILNMIPDWIFLLNKDAVCIDLKQAKGYDDTADFRPFLGKRFHDLFPIHFEAEISATMERAQQTDAVQSIVLELQSDNRVARYECRIIARGESQFLAILRLA